MSHSDQHELVARLKDLAIELGRTPTKNEFAASGVTEWSMRQAFGNFSALVQAAGMMAQNPNRSSTDKQESKLIRQYQSICSKTDKIQGFYRHVLDLREMFNRAGNPPILKILAQGDTHAKFVDRRAWGAYKSFAREWQPHGHLIMGDFVDCEGLSHWPSDDMEPRRIVPELKIARQLLQEIVDATPTCTSRIYLTGNHENWIDQAFSKMPELFDGLADLDIEINLKTLLGLPKFGYELFPLNHLVQIGKAHFSHGLYTGTHHAKKHLDVLKTSFYYGHLHDLQEHHQTSVEGPMEASSVGCLCRLDARFLKGKPNNWAHAVPCFEFFPDGRYNFYKLRIIDGRVAYGGKIFEA